MKLSKLRTLLDWKDGIALLIGGGAIVGMGLSNISRWSIWFDEAFSEHITRHSFFDILRYTAADVHPPLYYWALKLWRMVFGNSELALRSLSLFFLFLTGVAVYIFVKAYFSRRAAIYSLLLLTISPLLFRYGIEARMYTMELLIAIAATAVLARAVRGRAGRAWLAYGALLGFGMLTHYLMIVLWAAHGVWLVYQNRQKNVTSMVKKTLATGYGKALVVAGGVTALWVPLMVWQIAHIQGGGFWIGAVTMNTIPNLLGDMYAYKSASEIEGWHAVLIMATIAASIWAVNKTYRSLSGIRRQTYSLLITSAVLPPIFLILGSMPPLRSSFVNRYLMASIAVWFIVTAIALAYLWARPQTSRFARALGVLLVGILLAGCSQVYTTGNINKDNGSIHTMRRAMQIANNNAEGDEPIIADSPWRYFEASYYEQPPHTVYFRADDNTKVGAYEMLRSETDHKILVMNDFGKKYPVAWFVVAQSRDEASQLPRGWREVKTYLVDDPSRLRVVKMEYIGDGLTGQ